MSSLADSIHLQVLTNTSLDAGAGADSIVVKANVSAGYLNIGGAGNDTSFLPLRLARSLQRLLVAQVQTLSAFMAAMT